jgi:diguanylate cyclase (GGDEF)-like protein/PAS domain S-box-containing protein
MTRHFFSLKWKALLSTTLVLVAVTVAISLRNYANLTNQFDRQRQIAHQQYVKEKDALLQQSLGRLRQLGGLISALPGVPLSLADRDSNRLKQALEPQWPALQLDLGIDMLAFYDTQALSLARWHINEWGEHHSVQIVNWISQVNASETPIVNLLCDPNCRQYAIVPVLTNGIHVGAVLVGSSVADLVLTASQISGNDIGLLVRDDQHLTGILPERQIQPWSVVIAALTQTEKNLKIIQDAAASTTLLKTADGVRHKFDGRFYDIRIISLQKFVADQRLYWVVIADITATLEEIRATTQEVFLVGGLGWLLAEGLLLIILWTPMERLRLTANNLPLLAQRRFQAARTAIRQRYRQHFIDDELDILENTAIALADRLEQLEEDVAEHTQMLSTRMEELAQERNFVTSLLNTAQVMIITQDRHGCMLMVNPYVQSVTGYSQTELTGQSFKDLLLADKSSVLSQRIKKEIIAGKHEHISHESLVTGKGGAIRNVTWHHSRLTGAGSDGPAILSVGLDITERLGAELELAWLTDHDLLTGLLNRNRFQVELERVLANLQRQKQSSGALLCIDLDQFKYINDTDGHQSGDALLKIVADMLSSTAIAGETLARLGSDEYALLLQEVDANDAIQLANTINALLATISFSVSGHPLKISSSIGIVLFPDHGDNVADLLANADLAVSQAKLKGHSQWHVYSDQDTVLEQMQRHVYWKNKVTQALANDRFILFFQPIMEVISGRISHYEVLLRMQDEDGSIIGPANFIEVAERGGLIYAIDRLVIQKALQFLATIKEIDQTAALSINLSAHVFRDPHLISYLRQELKHTGVDASRVVFEITETAAVADLAIANNLILAIKKLGCRFALDDFGIGFSSFYYLKHLPVDYLKIDGSFIRHLVDSSEDKVIVQAMSEVANGFGKKTIAEFVETQAILDLLHEYRIDYAQGYLISKPLSTEQTFQYLRKSHKQSPL